MGSAIIVLLVLVGILILIPVMIYNGMIRSRNEVRNSWSQIDVQLKRRHDLIPNLVETCKGYMKHERETLENIARLRSLAVDARDRSKQIEIEGQISQALAGLRIAVESYPELKANQNFLSLQEELTSTENKIGFARQYYNDAVYSYNNRIQVFPNNLFAGVFNFHEESFFKVEDVKEREAVRVAF